ncbi:hypothetical protein [Dehalogenimonas etheniformans]|uniref:Uncharacterized protein n=1 Tax=Dehalogenimonas etheniformans TaxID=1536648 RepID=A0A2P5P5D7_9CHLR|nr:hypothetical protein [Dehalogenimonas etheniformans]PPD57504.1 hypothetical protein JP09_009255 [Dehalogenimonas etheniformans]QNT76866.1 hypothetical protein HX448_09350 [Dehalogenimonas etheniformans]
MKAIEVDLKILILIALLAFSAACGTNTTSTTSSPTSSPPTTTPPISGTTGVPGVQVVTVAFDPTQTPNPGGPIIIIELKNITAQAIVTLDVKLYEPINPVASPWTFNFGVSQTALFDPGVTIGHRMRIISGSWGAGTPYFVTVAGTFSSGVTFAFRWTPPGDGDFGTVTPPP